MSPRHEQHALPVLDSLLQMVQELVAELNGRKDELHQAQGCRGTVARLEELARAWAQGAFGPFPQGGGNTRGCGELLTPA